MCEISKNINYCKLKYKNVRKAQVLLRPPPVRGAPAVADKEHIRSREHKRQNERAGPIAHRQQVAHDEIGVIPEQGGEADTHRHRAELRHDNGERDGQHVRKIEIPVVHMRQKKGDSDADEQCTGQKRAVGKRAAMKKGPHEDEGEKGKGSCDSERGVQGIVLPAVQKRKNRRGIIVEC